MKQEDWTKRLEERLAEHQETPSHDLWADIEAQLGSQQAQPARFVSLRRWAVAAAVGCLMLGGGWLYWRNTPQPQETAQAETKQPVAPAPADTPAPALPKPTIIQQATAFVAQKIEQQATEIQEQAAEIVTPPAPKTEEAEEKSKPHLPITYPEHTHQSTAEAEMPKPKTHRQLALNVYAGGSMGDYSGRNGVMMSAAELAKFTVPDNMGYGNASRTRSVVYLADYEECQYHDQPISVGLTFSYPLTQRLSLSSGVVYTRLHSSFLNIMGSNQLRSEQTLHYVGIPLNVQYQLWRYKGLKTYVMAGGEADWNVKSEASTENIDQEMRHDRMQWSVAGSIGVEYDIIPQIGLYAEPGIRYYFDNGSTLRNFFKDKPTNFDLQIGLRVNLK